MTENKNGSWTPPEVIAASHAQEQDMVIDINGNPHIVANEKNDVSNQLVHYFRNNTGWHRQTVEQNFLGYKRNKIVAFGSALYWTYMRIDSNSIHSIYPKTSIHFRKLDIVNGIGDILPKDTLKIFPNPFSREITITAPFHFDDYMTINIYNVKGNLVRSIATQMKNSGMRSFVWDGTDVNDQYVPPGVYYVRYESRTQTLTQPVVFYNN